jgi:hypothetical protein
MRALGAPAECDQDWVISTLGPREVSAEVGLHRGDHSALRELVFDRDAWGVGLAAESYWIRSFDHLYELAATRAPLQLSGATWYHHCAVRGVRSDRIWIANSAPGYRGVFDTIDRVQFERLGRWRATCVR